MPTITDPRDGQVYPTVQIGTQCWLQKNMNYQAGNSWCYDNNIANCNTYGRLYDWETAFGACPSGWHLPTDDEWCTVTQYTDPTVNCNATSWNGTDVGLKMKSVSYWYNNGNGTNSSGFTALPGGYYNGSFSGIAQHGVFWSSTPSNSTNALSRDFYYNYNKIDRHIHPKNEGFSVRCVRNVTTTMPTVTTSSIINANQTFATGGGNVTSDGGATVTSRGVCWSTSQNPTISDDHTIDGTGTGIFTSNITGLTANTPYYVRAYATNSVGTSYGDQVSFTTTGGGGGGQPCPGIPTITDPRDGNVYPTVQIGTQCWLQKNMNYQTGNSWCYDDDPSNCSTYGRLYDWETAFEACPSGWHLPTDDEWCTVTQFIDPTVNCNTSGSIGTDVGLKMKSTSGWNNGGNGTNVSGFTAFPSGARGYQGSFAYLGTYAFFWSSSEYSSTIAWDWTLDYSSDAVSRDGGHKTAGFNVRCVRE